MPIAQPRSTWDSSKRATHLLLRLLFKLDGLKQLKEAPWPGCRKEKPVEPVEIVGKSWNLRFLVLKMELWKWEVELAVGCFVFYNSRGASSNASKVASLGRVKAWKPLFWRWDADQTWDETKKTLQPGAISMGSVSAGWVQTDPDRLLRPLSLVHQKSHWSRGLRALPCCKVTASRA